MKMKFEKNLLDNQGAPDHNLTPSAYYVQCLQFFALRGAESKQLTLVYLFLKLTSVTVLSCALNPKVPICSFLCGRAVQWRTVGLSFGREVKLQVWMQ